MIRILAVFTGLLILFSSIAFAVDPNETPEQADARRARWDKGPRTIDVSNYPAELQEAYKLFLVKCSKCHNIARPINAEFTVEEWERYVKRMIRKPGSDISMGEGKKIFEFLKYYAEQKQKAQSAKDVSGK